MGKKLVIVESPAKAETIKKILGRNYEVTASYGHIRDLPKSKIGVDIEDNFKPSYNTIKGKGEITKKLRALAKKSDKIYLASDMDREGEAIAWHVANILKLDIEEEMRIEFNEITKTAIKEAIKHPQKLNMNKVDAQQARRILDRLVGYKISPLLWQIIDSNTSAGRVQSVALKLICDLEDTIKAFIPEKYWEVKGLFNKVFEFNLNKIDNKKVGKIKDEELVITLKKEAPALAYTISSIKVSNKKKNPPLPLKTSTLQQLASSYLGFSASKTMRVAQSLYEGLDIDGGHIGLITYMRTDSTRISDEAKKAAKEFITEKYGEKYVGKQQEKKTKKKIQDAHEGIRPTDVNLEPNNISEYLNKDQYKLYKLIWDRFVISQLAAMEYEQMEIICEADKYQFRGIANKITFDGYYKLFKEEDEIQTEDFPDLKQGTVMDLSKLDVKEGITKPPARLTESSLVKKLEAEGIGRPSTYAAIIETLKKREYVELDAKKFIPTELGYEVKGKLEKYFPNIMNVKFTAQLEGYLDEIEEGDKIWTNVLQEFYDDLKDYLKDFEKEVEAIMNRRVESDVLCPVDESHGVLLLKTGRFGKYLACEKEDCSGKFNLKGINIDKEQLEAGKIIVNDVVQEREKARRGKPTDLKTKDGKMFYLKLGRFGSYLESEDFANDEIRESLPSEVKKMLMNGLVKEENEVVQLKSILDNIKAEDDKLLAEAGVCEKCGSPFEVKAGRWGKFLACTGYPECKNIRKIPKKK